MTHPEKRNQADQDQSDDPRQATESGEPEIDGHMRGRRENEQADKLDSAEEPAARRPGNDQDWESDRQPPTSV
jgi:hypothetical protein